MNSLLFFLVLECYTEILIPSRKLELFSRFLFLLCICHGIHQLLQCFLIILSVECVHGIVGLQIEALQITIACHHTFVIDILALVVSQCLFNLFISSHLPVSFYLQVF